MVCICNIDDCKKKAKPIVGHCNYCDNNFCLVHRLPEQHNCEQLQRCNANAKELLTNKLNNEAIKSKKLLGY